MGTLGAMEPNGKYKNRGIFANILHFKPQFLYFNMKHKNIGRNPISPENVIDPFGECRNGRDKHVWYENNDAIGNQCFLSM